MRSIVFVKHPTFFARSLYNTALLHDKVFRKLDKFKKEKVHNSQFFDKPNFPPLFSSLFRTEKSVGNFDFIKICAVPSFFLLYCSDILNAFPRIEKADLE